MTREEALIALSGSHEKAGFTKIEGSAPLTFDVAGQSYVIPDELVTAFVQLQEDAASRRLVQHGAGICAIDYRETAVSYINEESQFTYGPVDTVTFGDPDGSEPYSVVGEASDTFVAAYLLNPDFLAQAHRRCRSLRNSVRIRRLPEGTLPTVFYRRPLSIRLGHLPPRAPDDQLRETEGILGACLYTLSSRGKATLRTYDRWPEPPAQGEPQRFAYEEIDDLAAFPFPKATYNADLLRFYTLGMSSDVPELQYLAFYQVLEYFFVSVSDEQLYAQLGRRLHNPGFRTTAIWLDRIIQDVTDHRRTTDETEMLKLVIAKFLSHSELIAFLERLHSSLGDTLYWNKRSRFGSMLSVSKEPNHTLGDVARIVKAVRNALVHSSDRHERAARHVPFSASSELVRLEVPLVRFLAEQAIIGSARPVE